METTTKAALQGTTAQIAFAESIRTAGLKSLEPIMAAARAYVPAVDEDEYDTQVLADLFTAYNTLLTETSAVRWIQHRKGVVGLSLIMLVAPHLYSKADFRFITGK